MSEKYYHGVRVMEEGAGAVSSVNGISGLQVVVGTAPINLAEDPEAAVNVPILCYSLTEARKKLGYCEDFATYTLCQSMYASYIAYRVAPVVFINVLDPARHKKDNEAKEYGVVNSQVIVDDLTGILKNSVKVKTGETVLEENKDYILSFNAQERLVITLLSEQTEALTSVSVESVSIDPSKVTVEDIIGGYDVQTGKESGLEVIRQVYPRTGVVPALLLAPGWSHNPDIGSVMLTKSRNINGVFTAECLLDLPTEETRLYTDVARIKEKSGYEDEQGIVLWPMVEVNGQKMYYSAIFGAMTAYTDASNDDVPSLYLSNKPLHVDKAVLEDGTEVFMDREQANTLNGVGVVTLISENGWRSWGNNTSVYPAGQDIKNRWIACRRMFTWMANSLITIYHDKVDSPANFRLIESICDSENIRLNSYISAGKLAGGRIEYNEEENSVENILNGQVIFHIYMAAYTPAEDIVFVLRFDPELLRDSLTGGAA